ncbi:MAG TPA: hypothetical protein PLH37_01200 [bacterium]|nr:hypothetical protein [bacterium]
MSSRERFASLLKQHQDRFAETRPQKSRKIAALVKGTSIDYDDPVVTTEMSTNQEDEEKKMEEENLVFLEITNLLKNNQWMMAFERLEKIEQEKNNLTTDFYIQLNDFIIDYKFTQDDSFELDGFASVFFDKCLEKIATKEENAFYLLSLFTEDKISNAVLTSIDLSDNDENNVSSYYYKIARAILKTKNPRAAEFISLMLANWDKKIIAFYSLKPKSLDQRRTQEKKEDILDEENYQMLLSVDDTDGKEIETDEQYLPEFEETRRYLAQNTEKTNINFDSDTIDFDFGSMSKRDLLDVITGTKDEKVIGNLINFIVNDENASLFLRQISDIINQASPERAVGGLLGLLKSTNEFTRRDASAVLYRLEFGRIGISEQGVKYLEKRYDLETLNNPAYHARRISCDGEIGIFNQERELIKFFKLEGLSEPEKKAKAKVLDFTYEHLFISRFDETPAERTEREKILAEYKSSLYEIIDIAFKETGVDLTNLSRHEQGWFVVYYKRASLGEKNRIKKFASDFSEQGIRTFLALENGFSNGSIILDIADRLSKKDAQALFSEYNLTLDEIQRMSGSMALKFEQSQRVEMRQFPVQLEEAIRRRSADLFLSTHHLLNEKNTEFNFEDVTTSLQAMRLFLSIISDFNSQNIYNFQQEQNVGDEQEYNYQYLVEDKKTTKQYRLRYFIRPQASARGEARVAFTLAFEGDGIKKEDKKMKNFFAQDVAYAGQKSKKQKSEFSIRIDRDTREESARISLDLGRNKYQDEKMVRSGDRLGNLLCATTEIGSHNVRSFDQSYAEENLFAELAQLLNIYLVGKDVGSVE